jgi:hypothetical protein
MTQYDHTKTAWLVLTPLFLVFNIIVHQPILAQAQNTPSSSTTNSKTSNSKAARHFEITQMGELRDDDGLHISFTAFKAPDGTKLTIEHHEFDSKAQAQDYFQKAVGRAREVSLREKKKNAKGEAVGERAQATLESAEPLKAVFWTDGPDFYEVFSSSLPDVLETEKRLS